MADSNSLNRPGSDNSQPGREPGNFDQRQQQIAQAKQQTKSLVQKRCNFSQRVQFVMVASIPDEHNIHSRGKGSDSEMWERGVSSTVNSDWCQFGSGRLLWGENGISQGNCTKSPRRRHRSNLKPLAQQQIRCPSESCPRRSLWIFLWKILVSKSLCWDAAGTR